MGDFFYGREASSSMGKFSLRGSAQGRQCSRVFGASKVEGNVIINSVLLQSGLGLHLGTVQGFTFKGRDIVPSGSWQV